jgi:ribonuclease T
MEKRYISFDIEASGPTPGKYSMLSLGACIVGDTSIQFYRELKPISSNFVDEAMRVSAKGLRCLDDLKHQAAYNPRRRRFDPVKVLEVLTERGDDPKNVMLEYANWARDATRGYKMVEAATPIRFDGMFTSWYFDNFFAGSNPFGYNGEDIGSMYRGFMRNPDAHIGMLKVRKGDLPHNALEDAIIQAHEFERVLELFRRA